MTRGARRMAGESRIDVADRVPLVAELVAGEPDWGCDDLERPVILVAHGGLIAALTAALLDLPVDNWPALGGWVTPVGPNCPPTGHRCRLRRPALAIGCGMPQLQVANDVL